MLIEPKTTPVHSSGKYLFGAGAAILIFIFTEMGIEVDAELLSLLVMNGISVFFHKKGGMT
jgi:Na+-translocating ferredoxin:NAD+ oxidoreductase RnfD subunit